MDKVITTLLDVLGLLSVAAGVYFWAQPHIGRSALILFGAVVLAGSAFASREPSQTPVRVRLTSWWQALVRRARGVRG